MSKLLKEKYRDLSDKIYLARNNIVVGISDDHLIKDDRQLEYFVYLVDEALGKLYDAVEQKIYRLEDL